MERKSKQTATSQSIMGMAKNIEQCPVFRDIEDRSAFFQSCPGD